MARYLIALGLLLLAVGARGECFDRAAARFRLDADLLRAMAEQESNNRADAIGPLLADGNRALGKMQVNTVHLPELERHRVTKQDLLTECGSVFVGAWIFARYTSLAGDMWTGVGFYNTGPKSKNFDAQARYIAAVRRRYERIKRARAQGVYAQRPRELVRAARTMKTWESQ